MGMGSPDARSPLLPGAKTYLALIGMLSLIGAVPLCWWLADQRIVPWSPRIEGRRPVCPEPDSAGG
jgi:hypothetical protein